MAGETTKTVARSNSASGLKSYGQTAKGTVRSAEDLLTFASGELELADSKITNISLPSNCIPTKVEIINVDLDTHACSPTLVLDLGVAAQSSFSSVTSGTVTKHIADEIISSDLLVDGSTEGQSANTVWTDLPMDTTNFSAANAGKQLWERLGYDKDPGVVFKVSVTAQVAAATAGTGACGVRVTYIDY